MRRVCTEYICCLKAIFKKKLLQKGYYDIEAAVDPANILWENIGNSATSRAFRILGAGLVSLMLLAVSLYVYLQTSFYERAKANFEIGACTEPQYVQARAYSDFLRPLERQQGVLNCYCSALYSTYGFAGMRVLFADGNQHCKEWYQAS